MILNESKSCSTGYAGYDGVRKKGGVNSKGKQIMFLFFSGVRGVRGVRSNWVRLGTGNGKWEIQQKDGRPRKNETWTFEYL